MEMKHLGFNVAIGQKKPENIIDTNAECPFCDRAHLTDILDACGEMLLIKNKYHVLADSFQTVLIETADCHGEMSNYTKERLHSLIRFGVKHWLAMIASQKYKSVLFFKNHGPFSGGTIRHPHMQIIGLKTIDYHMMFDRKEFNGIVIDRRNGVEFNISTYPRIGFSEFNVVVSANEQLDQMADYIQTAIHYLLNRPSHRCQSYNIFFYLIDGLIRVKVMPRAATSPLYIGYNIHLIPNNLASIVKELQNTYFK